MPGGAASHVPGSVSGGGAILILAWPRRLGTALPNGYAITLGRQFVPAPRGNLGQRHRFRGDRSRDPPRRHARLRQLGGLRVEHGFAAAAFDAERALHRSGEPVLDGEDGVAAGASDEHQPSGLSSPNAVCSARTASSAYFSSMRQLTLISLVEMTRMLTPSSASTWNIFAATPAWLRMPTPTM